MKSLTFRPLRRIKKTGKIAVASYTQWNKIRCANYSEFILIVNDDYKKLDKDEYVYDHEGELLFHFNYNPWDVFVYYGSCLDAGFSWDELRKKHKSFRIIDGHDKYCSYFMNGADCAGTPTFSHLTMDKIDNARYSDLGQFEPLTVGYVIDWLGWFLYQLENSHLKISN